MELEGVDAGELTSLHGELIAHELIEQNTGSTLVRGPGVVASCYRITAAGLRMLKKVNAKDEDLEGGLAVVIPIETEVRRPAFGGRRRSKKGKAVVQPDEGKQADRESVAA